MGAFLQKNTGLKIFTICTLLTATGAGFYFAYQKYWKPKQIALWRHLPDDRKASIRAPAQLTETELPLLEDYFRYNSFHKFISYSLNLNFSSDASPRLAKKAKESFNLSLNQLFNKENKAQTLKAFSSPTLTSDFIANLLENMDQNNVDKGDYQIDLEFEPHNHPSVLFHDEAQSVGLWDLGHTNSIKHHLEERQTSSSLPTGEEYQLIRNIVSTEYPSESQYYQYQGGVISLSLGLDNLKWNVEEQKSKKADQLTGDLIYRRYFKVVHEDEFAFFMENNDMVIRNTSFARKFDDVPFFVTVDYTKEFNGHTLQSPSNRLIVYFGEMLPTQKRRRGFLQRFFGAREREIFNSGEFIIYGTLGKGTGAIEFVMRVHNLVYDFTKKDFSIEDSGLDITLQNQTIMTTFDRAAAITDIKRILLGPLGKAMSRKLSLHRFHDDLQFQENIQ